VALQTLGGRASEEALLDLSDREPTLAVQAALARSLSRSKNPKAKAKLNAWRGAASPELRRVAQEELDRSRRPSKP
jgi:hypothetical protein